MILQKISIFTRKKFDLNACHTYVQSYILIWKVYTAAVHFTNLMSNANNMLTIMQVAFLCASNEIIINNC